jgi:AraC family transcriptional regulator of adaptative response/methylated-DNA-[protein]-cysteine methyltransferase
MGVDVKPTNDGQDEDRWRAVQSRTVPKNGGFIFAVRTTGIYCLPSCPARRPHRENVEFFDDPGSARAAGYRACLRCSPDVPAEDVTQWVNIICHRLEESRDIPTLAQLAALVGLSASHVQRTFTREIGVSPRQYAVALRSHRLREGLRQADTVTDAIYDSGFNSSSAAYERAGSELGMTPRRWRDGGKGEQISFSVISTNLGDVIIAATHKGLVAVRFGERERLIKDVRAEFPKAQLLQDDDLLASKAKEVLRRILGEHDVVPLPLDIAATAFQARVWRELQAIPAGATSTYSDVARAIDEPSAVRAVARAYAANPVALVIPCHRVIRSDGSLAGYRWGIERKVALLSRESDTGESLVKQVAVVPHRRDTE